MTYYETDSKSRLRVWENGYVSRSIPCRQWHFINAAMRLAQLRRRDFASAVPYYRRSRRRRDIRQEERP